MTNCMNHLPVWRNWQTQQTQNLPLATMCRFESGHRHHEKTKEPRAIILVPFSVSVKAFPSGEGGARRATERISKVDMNNTIGYVRRSENISPTVGIIAEYNPFHNGHLYQLTKIHEHFPDATITVILSGSFTQRGEAAILDKWTRATTAVKSGADLVLELPYAFACRSAEHFARGGVQSLAALGIDTLAFGAESRDLVPLQAATACMDDPAFQSALHGRIASGTSYAAALSAELASRTSLDDTLLHAPNNILAIEYLRALTRYAPHVTPLLIPRIGAAYHDSALHETYASASAIRNSISRPLNYQPPSPREGDRVSGGRCGEGTTSLLPPPYSRRNIPWSTLQSVMPLSSYHALLHAATDIPSNDRLLRPLLARLLTLDGDALRAITGMNEGLEHRLLEKAQAAGSWDELISAISTSRYPQSRIARLLVHILTNFTSNVARSCDATGPRYLRVLAMNTAGAALLHRTKKTARLPIITKTSRFLNRRDLLRPMDEWNPLQQMLLFDIRATQLRSLTLLAASAAPLDLLTSPVYVKQ